jgi:hypothetical protein
MHAATISCLGVSLNTPILLADHRVLLYIIGKCIDVLLKVNHLEIQKVKEKPRATAFL